MKNNEIDDSLFYTELGKLMRENNPDQVKQSVTRVIQVLGQEVPANATDEWYKTQQERIVNSFLDYFNSLIKPAE